MERRYIHLRAAAILVGASLILISCARRPGIPTGEPGAMGPGQEGKMEEEKIAKPAPIREVPVTPGSRERSQAGQGAATAKESPLKDVFFDFDKAVLSESAKKGLNDNIRWLKANSLARIVIEGHCDERGINEYNLALGDRRAKAVRDFLVAGGIDVQRISIISYGEERPFVLGHDESAWKWNRRAHFVFASR